ncbi:MAG: Eco57I restriction-modification methylase domain-containing protein, partial [Candidatus Desulfofervidus auxilii]|nr:Eco57I restriction-modification methylase domain-containing protein [Candidatus Desulfofervidus auxilii]
RRAIEVAKVNLWLEAIKLSPADFRYDRLPKETSHILPSLETNFRYGDSLIELPQDYAIRLLEMKFKDKIVQLYSLRDRYIEDPSRSELVDKIENIKIEIRLELDKVFKKFLSKKEISQSVLKKLKPLHWILEFWFVFFDKDGNVLPESKRGFDIIIGNPPYGRIKQLLKTKEEKLAFSKIYNNLFYYQRGNYNYYKLFLEKCFFLLKNTALFSMIFPTAFLGEDNSKLLRKLFFEKARIIKILQFPEKTKVFEDVTQDVIILLYQKIEVKNDYKILIKTNISREELSRLFDLKFLEIRKSEIKEISEDYQIPIFNNPEEEWKILKKISTFPIFKGNKKIPAIGEIGVGHLDETIDKEFISKEPTGDILVKGIHLDRYFVDLDPEGPQPRWIKNKEEFFKKKPKAEEIYKRDKIIGRNTINRKLKPRLRFTWLKKGYVITNAIKYILISDETLNPYYIIGLLNSSLLNWNFELFSSQNNIRNYEIERLPIIRAKPIQQNPLVNSVKKIILLKKLTYQFIKKWKEWSIKLKNMEKTLMEILKNDAQALRKGLRSNSWTLNVSFYPNSENEVLDSEFSKFKVIGSSISNKIKIYGLNEENEENLIYEIEFEDRDLMLHVYCSILVALESKARIKTLRHLLSKTKVPIIREINKNLKESTMNIIRMVKYEFSKWLKEENIENVETDIIRVDNVIRDIDAKIDALVFKLYGLDEREIKVIFNAF